MGWAVAVYGTVSRVMVGSLPTARFAEYLLVPHAQANLATIPPEVTDEQAVLLADIASTGFAGAEAAPVRLGDAVVVFAQGPIGLCATVGARLMGCSSDDMTTAAQRLAPVRGEARDGVVIHHTGIRHVPHRIRETP
jgi:threonine dehydrogenase-like Zn-dependent dehydrogenase